MATTTNFGWTTPNDTDLVKDGAAAIRTLGSSIDTSFVDLKGGTTGQVLAKASGTDLDFSWVAQDDSNAIQNAIMDAKGDLIGATAADTPARLAVGTNGQVLTADSTASTGIKWATPVTGALTLLQTLTLSGTSTTTASIPSTYKNIVVYIKNASAAALQDMELRLNSDTGSNYSWNLVAIVGSSVSGSGVASTNVIGIGLLNNTATAINRTYANIRVWDYASTGGVFIESRLTAKDGSNQRSYLTNALYNNSAAISTLTFLAGTSTTFSSGTALIYGES